MRPLSQKSVLVFLLVACVKRKVEIVRRVAILTKQAGKMDMDHSFFSRYGGIAVIEINSVVQTTGYGQEGKNII